MLDNSWIIILGLYVLLAFLLIFCMTTKKNTSVTTGVFIVLLFFNVFVFWDSFGRPKPITLQWQSLSKEFEIIWADTDGNNIWFLVKTENNQNPTYLIMPYDSITFNKLMKSLNDAGESGGKVMATSNGFNIDYIEFWNIEPPALERKH